MNLDKPPLMKLSDFNSNNCGSYLVERLDMRNLLHFNYNVGAMCNDI
jgi:hypothetical protein